MVHRHGPSGSNVSGGRPVTPQRRSSYFRTRWPDHVAHPSARPDPDRHLWTWLGAVCGWTDRGNPPRRRRLVSAWREALAWRDSDDRDDACRRYGIAKRQERRLDGNGQRRAIPQMISRPTLPVDSGFIE